ncbi:MAG TPA: D-glycero-beta-D-manno-heptose-7-phosphate kinase [Candidatus Paceibacterota bacterium]|nr:D-glycero-beta-D-manno-heptose-7-phosphate kinase [Candidatus Paceibacterota bacterium]HRT55953.1 D-glycero-beta-D-manno-heptose-7-phosphate kinase [Candidatus Paceibacterota bacterium]
MKFPPVTRPAAPALLRRSRVRQLLSGAAGTRVLVIGDVMLDQFIWGTVARISPEAPVPVVEFQRESFMPGGAANVARNLTALGIPTELFGIVGKDASGQQLKALLASHRIGCEGLITSRTRPTSVKTRIVAHQQQVVRIDRESRDGVEPALARRLVRSLGSRISQAEAVIVGDYGKGVITQTLLDDLKRLCRSHAVWLSLDPKPVHSLDLAGLSLLTPNRKEAFELARIPDETRQADPLKDRNLMAAARRLLSELRPAALLVTLGELGMLLCQHEQPPIHIPTVAQEVFDVSGAGDTVIATFTVAITAGASPLEAAILSNHAAGLVVGKIGTATVSPEELMGSFPN